MHEPWPETSKFNGIRAPLATYIAAQPSTRPLSLIAFGSQQKGDCSDVSLLQPLQQGAALSIAQHLNDLIPKGKSPLAQSVELASTQLTGAPGRILLITDSIDTCGADLCATARSLSPGQRLHILGLNVQTPQSLLCAASVTGGAFMNLSSPSDFATALLPKPPPSNGLWQIEAEALSESGECQPLAAALARKIIESWNTNRNIDWDGRFIPERLRALPWMQNDDGSASAEEHNPDLFDITYHAEQISPDQIHILASLRARGDHAFLRLKDCRYHSLITAQRRG